jgi:hypothetical protein
MNPNGSSRGIELRLALILIGAMFIAIIAGILTFLQTKSWPGAVLAGGVAFAAGTQFLDWLITGS